MTMTPQEFDASYPHMSAYSIKVANLADAPEHWHLPFHEHAEGQILFVDSGLVKLETHDGVWIAPSQSALWVSGGVTHRFRAVGEATGYTIFLRPPFSDQLPKTCQAFGISRFLRALIERTATLPARYRPGGPEDRLTAVLVDELIAAPSAFLDLPMPADARLRRFCEALLAEPANRTSITDWASQIGMSERNMARLFKKETGLTLVKWRRHMHVVMAVTLLAEGATVKNIAEDLGYESPATFVAMFRAETGVPPRQFARERMSPATDAGPERPGTSDGDDC